MAQASHAPSAYPISKEYIGFMGWVGVKCNRRVVDPTTLGRHSMLLTYIILDFTALAGAAIAKDEMSKL
jgi:hypothetical protein